MRAVEYLLIVVVSVTLAAAVTFAVLRERDHNRTTRRLERLIETLEQQLKQAREDYSGLMDRLYERKNLPPSEVSMAELYRTRAAAIAERQVERKNGGPIVPRPIGPLDSAVLEMQIDARKRISETSDRDQSAA